MLRTTVITRGKGFDPLRGTIAMYPDRVNAVASTVFRQRQPELLAGLQEVGAPVKYPIDWQTERQRKAFFATNGFGHGIPYRRTGKLAASAFVRLVRKDDQWIIESGYSASYAPFVVGRLFRRGKEWQQRMHMGRWKKAEPKIERWQRKYVTEFQKALPQAFEATGAR